MGRSLGCPGAPDAPRGARARRPADRRPHRAPPRPDLDRGLRRRGDDLLRLHAAGGLDVPRAQRRHRRDPRRQAGAVRRRADRADRPGPVQHGARHRTDALRHRRRRHDRDDRPGRRRALRLRPHLDGHRAEGRPLLRPARHQVDLHPDRHRAVALDRARQRSARRPDVGRGRGRLVLRHHAAVLVVPLHPRRRAVGLGDVGRAVRPRARRHAAVRLARAGVAGPRAAARRRRAQADHQRLLPALHDGLRAGVPLRRLPAGLRARPQLGRDGVPRVRGLPRPGAHAGHAHRARAASGWPRRSPTRWPTCGSATW